MMFRRHEAFFVSLLRGVSFTMFTRCAPAWERHVPTAVVIIAMVVIIIIIIGVGFFFC